MPQPQGQPANPIRIGHPGDMYHCKRKMTLLWNAGENLFKGWYCPDCKHEIKPLFQERLFKFTEYQDE